MFIWNINIIYYFFNLIHLQVDGAKFIVAERVFKGGDNLTEEDLEKRRLRAEKRKAQEQDVKES